MKIDRDRFLLGMVLGGLLLVTIKFSEFSVSSSKLNNNNINVSHYVLAATTSASMFSTPTLTPSSIPLLGYCLNVPVLLYHHVQPDSEAKRLWQSALSVDSAIFDQQMSYLVSQGYTAISARQLIDALLLHTSLPPKSILLTFDDGYKDVYTYVYPILQKYHLLANLMIATGLVGESEYLSWGEIEEMRRSGLFYFTNHTWSHYPIDQGDYNKVRYEIQTAKKQLEERVGQTVNIFTYPYGSFNDESIRILREEGVSGAFSTIPGFWQCDSFIMALHRNRVGNAPLLEYGL